MSSGELAAWLAGGATLVIAILTWRMERAQRKQQKHDTLISHTNYKMALFERRFFVYMEIMRYIGVYVQKGRPDVSECIRLRQECVSAKFIFPEEVSDFLNDIIDKTFTWQLNYVQWEPLRERGFRTENLTEEERLESGRLLSEMQKIEDWFLNLYQTSKVDTVLGPHLRMPSALE